MYHYYLVYKPYLVLSQFTTTDHKQTLKDYFDVAKDVYAIGRLDYDSEGLLILSNDPQLNHRLLHPSFAHEREYWVQVDGAITNEAIAQLQQGLDITIDGKIYHTKKAKASLFTSPPPVAERVPPIRYRAAIPAPWIKLILTEGKNRQVRKMTAKTGYATLRLIRTRIEGISLADMKPGDIMKLSKNSLYSKLFGK